MATTLDPKESEQQADEETRAAGGAVIGPGAAGRKLKGALETSGDIAHFSLDALRAIPKLRLYPSEVFRQAAILVLSSGLIIWLMEFVIGLQCGIEANYTLKQVGAPLYSGIFTAWCGIREMAPYMWGYILAAKVGCGLVAEIGSMRISEEIDAMEVMGVRPMSTSSATRVVAAWIALPVPLHRRPRRHVPRRVAGGGRTARRGLTRRLHFIFWLFQNPLDFLFSMAKIMAMGTVIVFVGCYSATRPAVGRSVSAGTPPSR